MPTASSAAFDTYLLLDDEGTALLSPLTEVTSAFSRVGLLFGSLVHRKATIKASRPQVARTSVETIKISEQKGSEVVAIP
jgi:hypothetical protein